MSSPALTPVVQALTPALPSTAPASNAPASAAPGAFARELRSASADATGPDAAAAPAPDPSAQARAQSEPADEPPPRAQSTRRDLQRWLAALGGSTPRGSARTPPAAEDEHAGGPVTQAAPRKGRADESDPAAGAVASAPVPTPAALPVEATTAGARVATPAALAAEAATASALASTPVALPVDPATAGAAGSSDELDPQRAASGGDAAGTALRKPEDSQRWARRGAELALAAGTSAAPTQPAGQAAGDPRIELGGTATLGRAAPAQIGAPGSSPPGAHPAHPFAGELARAGHLAGAIADAGTAAPAQLSVGTPMQSPEFMPRLAGELLLLTRNGVQEARVQVHPAELGPIAVQISLDGNAAQIRLTADSALTRELLEQGMPTLAAALHESGLTLTGGGVFQQARDSARDSAREGQRGDSARAPESDAVAGVDGEHAATTMARRRQPLGQLDLYA